MKSILLPGGLCFDIGAHHGESADKLLNHAGAGTVVSIEPCLANYVKVVEHWKNDARVIPIHAAVLDTPGFAKISRAAAQDGLTTLVPERWGEIYPDAAFEAPEWVPVITLKMLTAQFGQPDFVKVDVEGVERSVIRGLYDVRQRPRLLSFEFHGAFANHALECLAMLADLGYHAAGITEEDIDLENDPSIPINKLITDLTRSCPNWGNITVAR